MTSLDFQRSAREYLGMNGLEKSFDAYAYNESEGFVIEVEAGRGE
jgi:hypothetical protein